MADEIQETEESKKPKSKVKESSPPNNKFLRIINEYGNICWINLNSVVFISNPSEGTYTLHCSDSNAYIINDKSPIAHLID